MSSQSLTLKHLRSAVTGTAAAFRCSSEYQPAGGAGDKVFPPTYEGGNYAKEHRRLPDREDPVECVLLDSVQSQANRMEAALLDASERGRISLPIVAVDFDGHGLPKPLRVTSLEAPHRVADALLRDSLLDGIPFRKSEKGRRLDDVSNRDATALFEICPTALVFGLWDSTGPRGGLGAKFARAMVSEIIGIGVEVGIKTSSRIDPAGITLNAGPLYRAKDGGWTLNEKDAARDKKGPTKPGKDAKPSKDVKPSEEGPIKLGKDGKPSEANHGNVTPTRATGGVTIERAVQTTVLSLPALRRLRFPLTDQARSKPEVDDAARTALAALALCAAALNREQGCDLRSRCLLVPTGPFAWELLDQPGTKAETFLLSGKDAILLYREAVEAARSAGLPWLEEEMVLKPSPQLAELVRKSQELAASQSAEGGEGD